MSRSPVSCNRASKLASGGAASGGGGAAALRQVAAQRGAAFLEILDFRAVRRRLVERRIVELFVGNRDVEAVAEVLERLFAHFLLRVGDVLAFAGHAHAVALDGLGQNHGRLAGMFGRGGVGRINLVRVVAAAVQPPDVLVGQVADHLLQFFVFAEEVLAGVGAALGLEVLVLAVHALFHELQQQALLVGGEQRVPVRAPQHFDDVPARPRGNRLPVPG